MLKSSDPRGHGRNSDQVGRRSRSQLRDYGYWELSGSTGQTPRPVWAQFSGRSCVHVEGFKISEMYELITLIYILDQDNMNHNRVDNLNTFLIGLNFLLSGEHWRLVSRYTSKTRSSVLRFISKKILKCFKLKRPLQEIRFALLSIISAGCDVTSSIKVHKVNGTS